MKLILLRNQSSSMLGKISFEISVKAETTEKEQADIKKYKMGSELLYSNRNESSSVLGAFANKVVSTELSIDDLVRGKKVEFKDIGEMMTFENQVIEASKIFKEILETMSTFGGETIIEI